MSYSDVTFYWLSHNYWIAGLQDLIAARILTCLWANQVRRTFEWIMLLLLRGYILAKILISYGSSFSDGVLVLYFLRTFLNLSNNNNMLLTLLLTWYTFFCFLGFSGNLSLVVTLLVEHKMKCLFFILYISNLIKNFRSFILIDY